MHYHSTINDILNQKLLFDKNINQVIENNESDISDTDLQIYYNYLDKLVIMIKKYNEILKEHDFKLSNNNYGIKKLSEKNKIIIDDILPYLLGFNIFITNLSVLINNNQVTTLRLNNIIDLYNGKQYNLIKLVSKLYYCSKFIDNNKNKMDEFCKIFNNVKPSVFKYKNLKIKFINGIHLFELNQEFTGKIIKKKKIFGITSILYFTKLFNN